MDAVTMFGIAGFAGAVLSGFVGYLARDKAEGIDKGKVAQDIITGIMIGLVSVSAGMAAVSPGGDAVAAAILGLLTGYGINSARVDAGIKK